MNDRRPVIRGWKIAAATVATIAIGTTLTPAAGYGEPAQEDPRSGGGTESSSQAAVVEIDVDVAEADSNAVVGTLEEIQANVANQLAQLDAAKSAVAVAEAELAAADAAVEATQAEIDVLVQKSDEIVVEAFMLPPASGAVETFDSDSVSDASVKQAILGIQADEDADVLAQLEEAGDELKERKQDQSEAAGEAAARKGDAEAALSDLEAATSQQAEFLGMVNARLDQGLAEVAALANIDPAMSAELAARQAELAAKLKEISDTRAYQAALEALAESERRAAEEAAANPPDPINLGPASGSLTEVACPEGGSITVDSALGDPLRSLLTAAAADGVVLCGSGYRSPDEQIAVRMANCGTSYYAIYQMPASGCSPPTARPGQSMHEQGLAIDFTCNGGGVIGSRSSPCYQWLDGHAAGYGLYNLPAEPWHFSTNGN